MLKQISEKNEKGGKDLGRQCLRHLTEYKLLVTSITGKKACGVPLRVGIWKIALHARPSLVNGGIRKFDSGVGCREGLSLL